MDSDSGLPDQRQLNPFALPAETNVRFTLLVMAALVLTFDLMNFIADVTGIKEFPPPTDFWSILEAWVFPISFVLAVLFLATIIYRSYPNRIRHIHKLQRLAQGDDPRFSEELQNLFRLSGVFPSPSIEIARHSQSTEGQAFGIQNHYALRLGGRLRLLLRTQPAGFRAIVLHEIAHIVNMDVTRTYFAQAIWIAFIILAIIPSLAWLVIYPDYVLVQNILNHWEQVSWQSFWTRDVPRWSIALLQIGFILAIVASIRSSVLRIREVYADWRAALWGARDSLSNILRRKLSGQETGRWTKFWKLHPSARERLEALENPIQLFRMTGEVPFFAGILLGFVTSGIVTSLPNLIMIAAQVSLIGSGLLARIQPFVYSYAIYKNPIRLSMLTFAFTVTYSGWIAAVWFTTFAPILWMMSSIVGAFGIQIQRETIAGILIKQGGWRSYLKLWKPALLAAIGFQLGIYLTPFSLLVRLLDLLSLQGLIALSLVLVLTVANAFLVWLAFSYIRFFTKRILGTHLGFSSPQTKRRLLTVLSNGLLLVVYLPAIFGQLLVEDAVAGFSGTTFNVYLNAVFIYHLIALVLYFSLLVLTWLLLIIYGQIWETRCPSCKQVTQKKYGLAQACEHCGKGFASWLYSPEQSVENQTEVT
jgi:Zn-dependent protease with chaperone function